MSPARDPRRGLGELWTPEVLMRFVEIQADGCWRWTGNLGTSGYGQATDPLRSSPVGAHRLAYELLAAPIPEGLTIDHLCRYRLCVNPEHLEPVTVGENLRRGYSPSALNARRTHCIRGHEFTPENTWWQGRQRPGRARKRACKACWQLKNYQQRQAV